jgi:rubrerythrin
MGVYDDAAMLYVKVVREHVSGAYLDGAGGCDDYTCECGANWMMDDDPKYCPGCGVLVKIE